MSPVTYQQLKKQKVPQRYYSSLYSPHNDRFIITTTQHPAPNNTNITKDTYEQSKHGDKTYKNNLNRAFNHVKNIVFFNPDMTNFITFTYHINQQDIKQVLHDIKQTVKYTRNARNKKGTPITPKYVYILEYQKRGALHVHMIANDFFLTQINQHGHPEVKYWNNGFTNIRKLSEFDGNFKPYLYLFKYMQKAERIGKRFIHTSRGLANFVKVDYNSFKPIIKGKTPIHTYESSFTLPNNTTMTTVKEYYHYGKERN